MWTNQTCSIPNTAAALALFLGTILMPCAAVASDASNSTRPSATAAGNAGSIIVIEQSVSEFLKLAGSRFGVDVKLPHKFRGTIKNLTLTASLIPVLKTLGNKFDFDWYREGRTVHISPRNRSVSRMIYLGKLSHKNLSRSLKKAGFSTQGYKFAHIPESNSVLVNGPPSLIAKIELLAEGYNKNVKGLTIIRYGSSS